MSAAPLALAAEGWAAILDPMRGASLLSLQYRGRDVVRRAPDAPRSPLDTGCFPLVPYANRIAGGSFAFDGVRHMVPLSDPAGPNSLHGIGWERAWRVVAADGGQARLEYVHGGDSGWPWRFTATLEIALAADGMLMTLAARNDEAGSRPMGLGLHPYFPIDDATLLEADVGGTLLTDGQLLPVREAPADHFADWRRGAAIAPAAPIDHCLTRWRGRAVLRDADRSRIVTAEGATALHLYAPTGQAFACLEPVTHWPDAINRGGMPMLVAGETATLTMRVAVTG